MTAIFKNAGTFFKYDTFGALSLANFLICAFSGIFLAIPYDVANPLESIQEILLVNPGASFFRNLHYWSAQFFLIFTLLHTWDYLFDDRTKKLKRGIWMRLVVSLFFVFYVMISGFILKADADSLQARRIIDALFMAIPLVGKLLSYSLIGSDESFQLLYVHHIATATIFLVIVTFEHAKTIWTKACTFFITLILLAVVSYLFRAPLHDSLNPIMKGPWYFLGFQEILHWMSRPAWSLLIIALFFVLVYYLPKFNKQWIKYARMFILFSFITYMILTGIAYFFRGENWQWNWQIEDIYNPLEIRMTSFSAMADSLTGSFAENREKKEGCVICHHNMTGFTPSHDPAAVGCYSCHSGDPYTFDKEQAHRKMIKIPGNLANASRTCGTTGCHPEIADRIQNTLMTTLSGIVSVDRFVFNESDNPDALSRISEIGHSPADQHLRDMCANCHLGNPKNEYGPISQMSRGGGCNACHLNYLDRKTETGEAFQTDLSYHPQLSVQISNDHCFGCHSRSGRISTNYEGWHETKLEKEEVSDWEKYRQLDDQRIFEFVSADVHHQKGMDCIDCHNSYELMGDGNLYAHEEFQVKIKCEDCHFDGEPKTMTAGELDPETYKILQLRKYPEDLRFLEIEKSGKAMVNTFMDDLGYKWLVSKNSGAVLPMIPPGKLCNRGTVHRDLSCDACHSAWAPQCVGCHNSFEKDTEGYDLLDNKSKTGTWVEYTGKFLAEAPVLGVDERREIAGAQGRMIGTFINGMVLSIDMESFEAEEEEIFHRFYAPTVAHTTTRKGRSCKSCHNDPLAIGYGRGKLEFLISGGSGNWKFIPKYAPNKHDGLPEDAWIGFLQERTGWTATRDSVRPFSLAEQKSILTVGACLTCHAEDSEVMLGGLGNFKEVLKRVSRECVLVDWEKE